MTKANLDQKDIFLCETCKHFYLATNAKYGECINDLSDHCGHLIAVSHYACEGHQSKIENATDNG